MTNEFMGMYQRLCRDMLDSPIIHTGTWQSTDTSSSAVHATHERLDEMFLMDIPTSITQLQHEMPAVNLPWAELHFEERVGGQPLNPPPSHTQWPWARHNARFQNGAVGPFSHSYPERMWPRYSGYDMSGALDGEYEYFQGEMYPVNPFTGRRMPQAIDITQYPRRDRKGIRFRYGDLNDLVALLVREPLTRQAYLPIWFPEDTGTHHGQRVPCTLGYHFMMRGNLLTCRYYMRSCDIIRHFPDDVYMAARLTQWIADEVNDIWETKDMQFDSYMYPGQLRMYISSLHAFVGDQHKLQQIARGDDPVHDRLGGSSQPS